MQESEWNQFVSLAFVVAGGQEEREGSLSLRTGERVKKQVGRGERGTESASLSHTALFFFELFQDVSSLFPRPSLSLLCLLTVQSVPD